MTMCVYIQDNQVCMDDQHGVESTNISWYTRDVPSLPI